MRAAVSPLLLGICPGAVARRAGVGGIAKPRAEDPKGLGRDRWFRGLTERRLWLNEGREFNLAGRGVMGHRVNTMIIGYAEIDGVEARVLPEGDKPAQLSRTVLYREIKPAPPAGVAAN